MQLLEFGNREENRTLSHLQGETEGELLQASAENRLIHGARGLLWSESHQGWIWHNALGWGGNSLLSWESITSLDLPGEKSDSSGKEMEDGWMSWSFSLSILTIFPICENGIACNFTKRTTLLLSQQEIDTVSASWLTCTLGLSFTSFISVSVKWPLSESREAPKGQMF